MKKLSIICLILLAVSACRHSAPDDAVEPEQQLQSMQVASDLSNQRVTDFAEDSVGRIWIGTFRGLNRYNGHNYHQYYCTDSIIDLPDNQICDLYNDSHNRLWVATINGVAIYDNNNHFRRVGIKSNGSVYADQIIESTGRDKRVYGNFGGRLDIYDEEANEMRTVLPNINTGGNYSSKCYFDRRNKLWTISPVSIRCYQPDDFSLIDSIGLPHPANTHYIDTDNDCIWLGGDRYIAVYDMRNHTMKPLTQALTDAIGSTQANIINIHPYEGGYWLLNTSNRGVIVYNSVNDRIWMEGDSGYPFDLPHFRITGFYTDSHKNLWVSSYDHGCTVINKYQKQFNYNTALHNFINDKAIISVDNDQRGNLWMANGYDGLMVYNSTTGEAHTIDAHTLSGLNAPNASLTFVKAAKDGQVWLASLIENKVWRCQWANGSLHIIKEYSVPAPLSIIQDSHDVIWVGTGTDWLFRHNAQTDTFDGAQLPKPDDDICFISGMASAGDNLYVSAFRCPLMTASWADGSIKIDTLDIPALSGAITRGGMIPTDLLYDSYGILWIGTVGNGLIQYDPEKRTVSRVSNLPCTDISSIEEDKQGHIWISTQYGLARYDRTSGQIKSYYANDGIGGNQFYDRASAILPDGTLVFGGTHGLTEFNPLNVGTKRKVPLVFEDLKIHNAIVDPLETPDIISKDLSQGQRVTLDNNENAFSISFAALDYASDEAPSYSYRLEGHDPYWIDARHNNETYYAKISPGDYTFRVRIADASNLLVDSEISIPIHISGSRWLSWWAITLYLLAIAAVIVVVYKHRQTIRHQQQRMDQMIAAMEGIGKESAPASPDDSDDNGKAPGTATSDAQQLSESDKKFLHELQTLMEAELSNPELDVNRLTEMMRISRTKFYYKVKSITGVNPSVFFKTYKLNRAAQLLKEGHYTVSEIADMTGYSSAAHFSTSFKKHFGQTPTVYSR